MKKRLHIVSSFLVGFVITAGAFAFNGYLPWESGFAGIIGGIVTMFIFVIFKKLLIPSVFGFAMLYCNLRDQVDFWR